MGTRHLIAAYVDGDYRIAQYGQWDGYPSGQGVDVLAFLRTMDRQRFERNVRASSFMSDEDFAALNADITAKGLSGQWQKHYPHLSRDAGADVLRMVHNGPLKLKDRRSFAADSLFCEWGYVIDLDANQLEVFQGFNTTALTPVDRFYGFTEPDVADGYQPIRKVHEWSLDALPTDEDFLATLEPPEADDAVHARRKERFGAGDRDTMSHQTKDEQLVPIGTWTEWGRVEAVGFVRERYYWIRDERGAIAMMPAQVVEQQAGAKDSAKHDAPTSFQRSPRGQHE